jgi:hypothetical protein
VIFSKSMKDMTEKEARAEALRRWGPSGMVTFRPSRTIKSNRGRLARYCCIVGNGDGRSLYSVQGQGHTWREAFDDAQAR